MNTRDDVCKLHTREDRTVVDKTPQLDLLSFDFELFEAKSSILKREIEWNIVNAGM